MEILSALIIFIIALFIAINFLYFILPSLAPIPFFPTNKKDLPMIIKTLLSNEYQRKSEDAHFERLGTPEGREPSGVKNVALNDVIIDLGAGTGTVLFAAANAAYNHHLPTQFIAVEIHPLLIAMMYIHRFFHPNKKNIHIIRADIFKTDYKKLFQASNFKHRITIYLYVGPFVMERLKKKLIEFPIGSRVVSYMYTIPEWEKKLAQKNTGVHSLYSYNL